MTDGKKDDRQRAQQKIVERALLPFVNIARFAQMNQDRYAINGNIHDKPGFLDISFNACGANDMMSMYQSSYVIAPQVQEGSQPADGAGLGCRYATMLRMA